MRRSPLVFNYTGKKPGYCKKHGKFLNHTTIRKPIPECPKCKNLEIGNKDKKEETEKLKKFLQMLRRNRTFANKIYKALIESNKIKPSKK